MTVHRFFQCVKEAAAGNSSRWHVWNKCKAQRSCATPCWKTQWRLAFTPSPRNWTNSQKKTTMKNKTKNTHKKQTEEDNWIWWQKSLTKRITELKATERWQHSGKMALPTTSNLRLPLGHSALVTVTGNAPDGLIQNSHSYITLGRSWQAWA